MDYEVEKNSFISVQGVLLTKITSGYGSLSSLIGYLLSGYVFWFMETALGKHIMQIFKSPCKKPVRDHGAKVWFSGITAAEAIPQPFFMVRRISA